MPATGEECETELKPKHVHMREEEKCERSERASEDENVQNKN